MEGRANARKDVTEVLKKLALQNPDIVFLRLNVLLCLICSLNKSNSSRQSIR